MMRYVKSGDKRRRGQLEHLAQKNAGNESKPLRKLPVKQYLCVCVSPLISFYGNEQSIVQIYIHSCISIHSMHRDSFNFIIIGLQKFEL
jgi:hypothetical protein